MENLIALAASESRIDENRSGDWILNLPALSEDEWDVLSKRLVLHAHFGMMRRTWRGLSISKGGSVPGGKEAEDIASEALTDVLQGRRIWNSANCPDFLDFMKSVVSSKLGHLSSSVQNKVERRLQPIHENENAPINDEEDSTEGTFQKMVREAVHGDPLGNSILDCISEGIDRPARIAERLGVDVSEIYNAQKRLRRYINGAVAKWKGARE